MFFLSYRDEYVLQLAAHKKMAKKPPWLFRGVGCASFWNELIQWKTDNETETIIFSIPSDISIKF